MVGRTVQQYRFLEKLGAGGMGEVYKAQDSRLKRFVAIKVLTSATTGDPERRRRFVLEAQSASALNHPNIITIHDILIEEDAQFLVMEYVQGKTLVDLIPKGGLRAAQVLKYSVQMTDALQAAHAAGIIHRDLKPGNIMVADSGLVKVLDFGLAKHTDLGPEVDTGDATQSMREAPLTVEGAILGTVSYMSPEQAQGRRLDARSDIFSMGLVIYEMATGARAFHGDSPLSTLSAILRDEARRMGEIVPEVPPELELVVSRCLRKSPDERWQSMQDLQRALAALKYESESGFLHRSRLSVAATAAGASAGSPSWAGAAPAPPPPPTRTSVTGAASAASAAPAQRSQASGSASNWPATGASPAPPQPAAPSGDRRNVGLFIGLAAGLVLLGAIGGGMWWWTHRATPAPAPEPPVAAAVESPVPAPAAVEPGPAPVEPAPLPVAQPPTPVPAQPSKAAPVKAAKQKTQAAPVPEVAPAPETAVPQTAPPEPAPAPVAAPAPAVTTVAVKDGSAFQINLSEDIPTSAEVGRPLRFVATGEVRVGDTVVIPKGALVTGQIAELERRSRFGFGGSRMTLRLVDAEAQGGAKVKVRAVPARRADGKHERNVETNARPKQRELEAAAGTTYIGYVDGDQTVTVHK